MFECQSGFRVQSLTPGTSVGEAKFANQTSFNKNSYLYNFTVIVVVVLVCSNTTSLDLESSLKHTWHVVRTTWSVHCWGELTSIRLRTGTRPAVKDRAKYIISACGG
jgi:hypothetical protein